MVFDYYNRLTRSQKQVYRWSDEVSAIPLQKGGDLEPLVRGLAEALRGESRPVTEAACQRLVSALTDGLRVRPVRVEVLAARPSRRWGELHGLYHPAQGYEPARIKVWMRTARRKQVVAFRTFLRTVIHELCHHLDYELLGLPVSFHTEGFYKRESSLVHQLFNSQSATSNEGAPKRWRIAR